VFGPLRSERLGVEIKKSKRGGRREGAGRKKGVPNKITKTVKMMILAALAKVGGERYLVKQAKENPTAFLTLLGKIMPTQVVGDVSHSYVAHIPPPENNTEAWKQRYAPQPQPTKH